MPGKEAETEPWDKLCLEIIGQYTICQKGKHKTDLALWAVTMIDPAMGWFEILTYDDKK